MKKFHDNSNYASAPAVRVYMESRNLTTVSKLWVVVKYDIKALVDHSDCCKWTGAFNRDIMHLWERVEGIPVLLTSDFLEVKSFMADKSEEYYLDGGTVERDVDSEVYGIKNARKRGFIAFCYDVEIKDDEIMFNYLRDCEPSTSVEFWDNEKGLVMKHD